MVRELLLGMIAGDKSGMSGQIVADIDFCESREHLCATTRYISHLLCTTICTTINPINGS